MRTSNAGRKEAQRIFVARSCEMCASKERLQRHHRDRNPDNNSPVNIQILCQACHKAEHMKDGDRKSTRLNSSHCSRSRMPSSA